jgi:putative tryptophan/tyrosine transport system substrate-binding protein
VKRREFVALLSGAAAAWPLATGAQPTEQFRRLGVLMLFPESDPQTQPRITALLQGLERLGWIVGRNLRVDYQWDVSDEKRAQAASVEALRLAPDVILAHARPAVAALQQATRTVPIVFTTVNEPVAQGFVQDLAHPGGNITGFSYLEPSLGSKWLELLKDIAPSVRHVAVMWYPEADPILNAFARDAKASAQKFLVEVVATEIHETADIEAVFAELGREPGGGLILPPNSFTTVHRKLIIDLATRYRLPAIYGSRNFAGDGGLIFYGANPIEQFGQAAQYIDRILRGEKPRNLPVQQPTKFELVIDLRAAKALGLTVPGNLLLTADKVIE